MSTISFAAAFNADTRSASMDAAPSGFVVQTESENRRFRTYRQALSFVHEHLGRFPAPAERLPAELWGLVVTVSAGSAVPRLRIRAPIWYNSACCERLSQAYKQLSEKLSKALGSKMRACV